MDQFAVIMAGGSGVRLWPISREFKPKQFISAGRGKSMLQMTVERIISTIPPENCYIITGKELLDKTRDEVKSLIPETNILAEPKKRNTAACISYSALYLERKHKKGLVCFLPADSVIENSYNGNFMTSVFHAFRAAEKSGELVVIGVKPTYPSTGYGYIKINPDACLDSKDVFRVSRFIEKPDFERAKAYLDSGEYLWNSGMVIGSLDAVLNNVSIYLPDHYNKLSQALEWCENTGSEDYVSQAYDYLDNISFDTGVLEKTQNIHVVQAFFNWEDVGTLDALSKSFDQDENNNRVLGSFYGRDSKNSVVYSDEGLIATIGVENLMIVRSGDAVLVCPKNEAQKVKLLVEEIKANGYLKYL